MLQSSFPRALFALLLSCGALSDAQRTTINGQTGTYPVSVVAHELQTDRNDTLAPEQQQRRLKFWVYQPRLDLENQGCDLPVVSNYMPPTIEAAWESVISGYGVPGEIITTLQVETCSPGPSAYPTAAEGNGAPGLLLFSHGAGGSQYVYQTVLAGVASRGFAVVAVEHTFDAAIVEFADGSVALNNYPNVTSDAYVADVLTPARAADISSVLDAIEAGEVPGLERYAATAASSGSTEDCETSNGTTTRAAFFGHSLGGQTAWSAAQSDGRIAGALDFDGTIFPPGGNGDFGNARPLSVPLLLFGSQVSVQDPATGLIESWRAAVAAEEEEEHAAGYARIAYAEGTGHLSHTDLPLIVDVLGLRDSLPPPTLEATGSVSGERMRDIVASYTEAFSNYALRGVESSLLEGASDAFPEVVFPSNDTSTS